MTVLLTFLPPILWALQVTRRCGCGEAMVRWCDGGGGKLCSRRLAAKKLHGMGRREARSALLTYSVPKCTIFFAQNWVGVARRRGGGAAADGMGGWDRCKWFSLMLVVRKCGTYGRVSPLLTSYVYLFFNGLLCRMTWRRGKWWGVRGWVGDGKGQGRWQG